MAESTPALREQALVETALAFVKRAAEPEHPRRIERTLLRFIHVFGHTERHVRLALTRNRRAQGALATVHTRGISARSSSPGTPDSFATITTQFCRTQRAALPAKRFVTQKQRRRINIARKRRRQDATRRRHDGMVVDTRARGVEGGAGGLRMVVKLVASFSRSLRQVTS
jgi:hypothetical protein